MVNTMQQATNVHFVHHNRLVLLKDILHIHVQLKGMPLMAMLDIPPKEAESRDTEVYDGNNTSPLVMLPRFKISPLSLSHSSIPQLTQLSPLPSLVSQPVGPCWGPPSLSP